MGITIHYKGSIKDKSLITQLQDEMSDISQIMDWRYEIWNEDQSLPFSASIVSTPNGARIEGHIPLRGITIHVDPEIEPFNLLFNPKAQLTTFMQEILKHDGTFAKDFAWISVKTQYGDVNAHIGIIKLLRYLKKKYIPDLEVRDEGEYWETNDKERLLERRGFLFTKMSQLENALASMKPKNAISTDELVDKIEAILRKFLQRGKGS